MKRYVHTPLAASLVLALFAACASAPSGPAPPAVRRAAPPEDARLVCREGYRFLSWQELGLPRQIRAHDVALSADDVWVLVEPSTLVRLPRAEAAAAKPTFLSSPDPEIEWTAVDVDPADGSLWLTKRLGYELVHLDPAGKALRVPLSRVAGDGGLAGVLAGADALFTTPTCADHALWSFERSGEMVDPAFAAPEKLDDLDTSRTVNVAHACPRVHLARDAYGTVVAFNPMDVRLHRSTPDGWTVLGGPYDLEPPGRYTDPSGARVETLPAGSAANFLPDLVTGLFFRDGEPVLLGSPVQPGRQVHDTWGAGGIGTVVYRERGGVLRPAFESCGGRVLRRVETDAHGFAALTHAGLLLGR